MTLDVDTPMRGRTEVIDEFGACTHTQVAYILYIYNYIYMGMIRYRQAVTPGRQQCEAKNSTLTIFSKIHSPHGMDIPAIQPPLA
jgi:hypothetical protein